MYKYFKKRYPIVKPTKGELTAIRRGRAAPMSMVRKYMGIFGHRGERQEKPPLGGFILSLLECG